MTNPLTNPNCLRCGRPFAAELPEWAAVALCDHCSSGTLTYIASGATVAQSVGRLKAVRRLYARVEAVPTTEVLPCETDDAEDDPMYEAVARGEREAAARFSADLVRRLYAPAEVPSAGEVLPCEVDFTPEKAPTYDELVETVAILSDPEAMLAIEDGESDRPVDAPTAGEVLPCEVDFTPEPAPAYDEVVIISGEGDDPERDAAFRTFLNRQAAAARGNQVPVVPTHIDPMYEAVARGEREAAARFRADRNATGFGD